MGIYSGYLICTDLDGTFIDNKSNLIEKNLEAVKRYMAEGGLFTVSTGRAANYLKEQYGDRLKINTHLICLNGTMIFDTEKREVLYNRFFSKEDLKRIEQFYPEVELVHFHTENGNYTEYSSVPESEEIHKLVFVCKTVENCFELRKNLEQYYGEICDFNRSWPTGLEMLPKGAGKGDAVRKLREILRDKIHTVICVGDFENDLTMLKEADVGVAVANAPDFVKEVADRVTASNEEGAIARIIEEII